MIMVLIFHFSFIAKVRFFQDIGVRDDAIGNMLVKFPSFLTYSLYKKLRPVVCSFLTSHYFVRHFYFGKTQSKRLGTSPDLHE
jgi:hypothetical protein